MRLLQGIYSIRGGRGEGEARKRYSQCVWKWKMIKEKKMRTWPNTLKSKWILKAGSIGRGAGGKK